MTSLESFPLFPKLIPELRIHIWHHALNIPRLVFIWKHEKRGNDYLRRSCSTPLLSVNSECRREALKYHASPLTGPCILPPFSAWPPLCPLHSSHSHLQDLSLLPSHPLYPSQASDNANEEGKERHPDFIQSETRPMYTGPGTDILYISGSDPPNRRYKPVSWTCVTLCRDLSSPVPTFSSIRRLAVDLLFLRSTPLYQFNKMPYSIWKLVVSDLRQLEELFVVIGREGEEGTGEGEGGGVLYGGGERGVRGESRWVEARLREAKEGYREYMECVWADEAGEGEIEWWVLPVVRVVGWGELVGLCWTSWE